MIEAVIVDSREPEWVQQLKFDGIPTSVAMLDTADVQAVTDDGMIIAIERKTSDDLLGSLRDERLFPQMARLAEPRLDQLLHNGSQPTWWPYLVITGKLIPSDDGKTITERGVTGWNYSSVQGALLSFQEMGVFVIHADNDAQFESVVLRLGNRKRSEIQNILPPRPGMVLGQGAALLASLPGVGVDRALELMRWCHNMPAHALVGLTNLKVTAPIGISTRKRIRKTLGLRDNQSLDLYADEDGEQVIKIFDNEDSQTKGVQNV